MRPIRYLMAAALLLAALLAQAQELVPVPALSARVMDKAGMLTAQQRSALENVLADYETRTGNQIAILLMDSTAPEVIEQYSIRVADAWKLGRKGVDDGVILLVARNNPPGLRRLRIEAGRGVQGTVTDAQSKRILQDVIAPHFRQNDYYGGLAAGIASLTALLDQEHFPAPAKKPQAQQQEESGFGSMWPFLLFAFVIAMALMRSRGPRYAVRGGNAWGRNAGIILGSGLGSRYGGFGGGYGGFGGGFGGGGGSGGGFSGGGGGFDGGGASGDW